MQFSTPFRASFTVQYLNSEWIRVVAILKPSSYGSLVFSMITEILTWIVFLRGVAAPRRAYDVDWQLPVSYSEAEFLDEIQMKVLSVFLLAIHSRLYSIALRFHFKLTQLLTVFTVHIVHCQGERKKT